LKGTVFIIKLDAENRFNPQSVKQTNKHNMSFDPAPNFNETAYYCDSEEIEVNLDEPYTTISEKITRQPMSTIDPFEDVESDPPSSSSLIVQSLSGADIVRTAIQLTKAATLKGNADLKYTLLKKTVSSSKKRPRNSDDSGLINTTIATLEPRAVGNDKKTSVKVKKETSRYWYYKSEDEDESKAIAKVKVKKRESKAVSTKAVKKHESKTKISKESKKEELSSVSFQSKKEELSSVSLEKNFRSIGVQTSQ
jgi:hypothetical protein